MCISIINKGNSISEIEDSREIVCAFEINKF
jgi:hypothetical protein